MRDIALIILGSVLALITSVVVEWVKTWISESRTRRLLRDLLTNEIAAIDEIIDRLVAETAIQGFIPFQRLNEVQNARQGYDRNRDWLILCRDDDLRRGVFNYYGRLNITCGEAQALENMALNPQNTANAVLMGQIVIQRQTLVATFRDLANRGTNIVPRLENI